MKRSLYLIARDPAVKDEHTTMVKTLEHARQIRSHVNRSFGSRGRPPVQIHRYSADEYRRVGSAASCEVVE